MHFTVHLSFSLPFANTVFFIEEHFPDAQGKAAMLESMLNYDTFLLIVSNCVIFLLDTFSDLEKEVISVRNIKIIKLDKVINNILKDLFYL